MINPQDPWVDLFDSMPPVNTNSKKRTLNDNELPYMFNLCVGQYIHSGRTYEHSTIRCNVSKVELKEAYNSGSQKCSFDLQKATENTPCIDLEVMERMKTAGVEIDNLSNVIKDEESYILGSKSYCELWLEIAKLGNSDLKWQFEKADIFIGGESLTES